VANLCPLQVCDVYRAQKVGRWRAVLVRIIDRKQDAVLTETLDVGFIKLTPLVGG